jgi:hypothetical protein
LRRNAAHATDVWSVVCAWSDIDLVDILWTSLSYGEDKVINCTGKAPSDKFDEQQVYFGKIGTLKSNVDANSY